MPQKTAALYFLGSSGVCKSSPIPIRHFYSYPTIGEEYSLLQ